MHETSHILGEGVTGLEGLIEAVDNEAGEGRVRSTSQQQLASQMRHRADTNHHILDEVIAVFKTLILEQFSPS